MKKKTSQKKESLRPELVGQRLILASDYEGEKTKVEVLRINEGGTKGNITTPRGYLCKVISSTIAELKRGQIGFYSTESIHTAKGSK